MIDTRWGKHSKQVTKKIFFGKIFGPKDSKLKTFYHGNVNHNDKRLKKSKHW